MSVEFYTVPSLTMDRLKETLPEGHLLCPPLRPRYIDTRAYERGEGDVFVEQYLVVCPDGSRITEGELREAAHALLGNVRLRSVADVEVRAENARLREQVRVLREELTTARLGAERRNKDLDALHLVWCNGGCNSGVHRYCGNKEEITEEVVALAERHVKRLREWFQSYKFKNRREVL